MDRDISDPDFLPPQTTLKELHLDESFESFEGYHLEILYLLYLNQRNIVEAKSIYNQIFENDNVSFTIKERVKKINEFNKYK